MLYRADSDHDLTADEIDGNFRELRDDVDTLIAAGVGVSISEIDVIGDQMTITMSNHTTQGPFTLPTAIYSDRGPWAPSTLYFVGDTFSINGTLYSVMFEHTSGLTFDAGANDGLGHDYYHALFSAPENSLPEAGTDMMVLKKFGATDFVSVWGFVDIDEITGFDLTHPADGETLVYNAGTGNFENGPGLLAVQDAVPGMFVTGFDGEVLTVDSVAFSGITGRLSRRQNSEYFITVDPSVSGVIDVTTLDAARYIVLSENITSITCSDVNLFDAAYVNTVQLILQQNIGTFTVTGWNDIGGTVAWDGGGSAPTMPTAAGDLLIVDIFTVDGGGNFHGKVVYSD